MKIVKPLTNQQVKNLPVGTHNVGGVVGLCVRKQMTTQRYFLRYFFEKKMYCLNLPRGISLQDSRRIGLEYRQKLDQGINPKIDIQGKKKKIGIEIESTRITFKTVTEQWIDYRRELGYWETREKVLVVIRGRLRKYIYPVIGNMVISEISTDDVTKILFPVYSSKSMCSKIKTLMNNVFRWSIIKKYRTDNPIDNVKELIDPLDISVNKVRNQPSLDFHQVPDFVKELMEIRDTTSLMLCFSILTCCRSQAVRLMKWNEIDLDNKVWTIPEEHDKVKGEGRFREIFLSEQSVHVLNVLIEKKLSDPQDKESIVFKNRSLKSYSDTQFISFIKKLHTKKLQRDGIGWVDKKTGLRITQHGFRSSFKTWSISDELGNNMKYDRDVSEYCLLHSKKDRYKTSYDRCDYEVDRRKIISDWGKWCWIKMI